MAISINAFFSAHHTISATAVPLEGAPGVRVGRSEIVGTPIFELLKHHRATVTTSHSETKNIEAIVRDRAGDDDDERERLSLSLFRSKMLRSSSLDWERQRL